MTTVSKVFNTDINTPCQYTHAHTLIHIHTYMDEFIRRGGEILGGGKNYFFN